jgi:hypothetical protein
LEWYRARAGDSTGVELGQGLRCDWFGPFFVHYRSQLVLPRGAVIVELPALSVAGTVACVEAWRSTHVRIKAQLLLDVVLILALIVIDTIVPRAIAVIVVDSVV